MYLCKFDSAGKRISTLLVGVHYKTDAEKAAYMADGYVEVSDEDYAYYVGNRGAGDHNTGYVRGADGEPVSAAAYVQTVAEKAAVIAAEYESQISELKDALATATLADNTELITSLKADYVTIMAAYQAALKGVD